MGRGDIWFIYNFNVCINIEHMYCYSINGWKCSFRLPMLILICSMIGLLICKYEPFKQEVSVILRWPLRLAGLLFIFGLFYYFESSIATSCNNVALLPYFTFGYISGEGYNSVGSLLWRKNILMHYLVFPMIFTLFYP